MKKFTVSEDTEVVLNGKKYLLESGDKIVIEAASSEKYPGSKGYKRIANMDEVDDVGVATISDDDLPQDHDRLSQEHTRQNRIEQNELKSYGRRTEKPELRTKKRSMTTGDVVLKHLKDHNLLRNDFYESPVTIAIPTKHEIINLTIRGSNSQFAEADCDIVGDSKNIEIRLPYLTNWDKTGIIQTLINKCGPDETIRMGPYKDARILPVLDRSEHGLPDIRMRAGGRAGHMLP